MDAPPRPTPEDLFARFRDRGDASALGALFDDLSPHLFRVALSLAPDAASAEDALQATWLTALAEAARWDASRPVTPWLVGILGGQVVSARRRAWRAPDPVRVVLAAPDDDASAPAASADEQARVRSAIDALPEPYRAAALLRWRYGLTDAQIAHVRDEPPGTTRSLLSRALERLRQALKGAPAFLFLGSRPTRGLDAVRRRVLASARTTTVAAAAGAGWFAGKGAIAAAGGRRGGGGGGAGGRPPPARPRRGGAAGGARGIVSEGPGLAPARSRPEGTGDATAAGEGEGASARSGSTIHGSVHDSRGRPVALARIELRRGWSGGDEDPPAASGPSDERGAFSLAVPPESSVWRVRAVAKGLTSEEAFASPGGAVALVLWGGGSVVGRVLDAEDGAPIAGASLLARPPDEFDEGGPRWKVVARSDASGAYRLDGVPLGRVALVAVPPAHALLVVQADVVKGREEVRDLYVRRGARVTGRVLVAGRPFPGARVETWSRPSAGPAATTDAEGRYRLEGLAPGPWSLRVRVPGIEWVAAGTEVHVPAGTADVTADLAVPGVSVLSGRVTLDGAPVPGALVGTLEGEIERSGVRTDGEGRFEVRFPDLTSEARILALHGDVAYAQRTVKLPVRDGTEVDLPLVRLGSVSGRVRAADGSALAGIVLDLQPEAPLWTARSALREDGTFDVRVGPGRLEVSAWARGWPLSPRVPLDVGEGAHVAGVDVILPAGEAFRGRVTDDRGRPVPRAWVEASHGRPQCYPLQAATDDDGRYEFLGLEGPVVSLCVPGRMLADAGSNGWKAVHPGLDSGDLVVRSRGNRVRGRVLEPDGSPCRSCRVLVWQETRSDGTAVDPPEAVASVDVSDADGRFEIGPLPAHAGSRVSVAAATDRRASPRRVGVEWGGDAPPEVVLRLEEGARLRGTVRNRKGEPVADVAIWHSSTCHPSYQLRSDRDGRFEIGPLPPGTHEATFRRDGWYCPARLVHVAETGQDATADVVLAIGGDVRVLVRDAEGAPVAGASAEFIEVVDGDGRVVPIDAWRTSTNDRRPHVSREGQTRSDVSGLVHRQFLPPGTLRVRVSAPGFDPADASVTVVDEATVDVTVVLPKPAAVGGR